MSSLVEYIKENLFTANSWSHNDRFDYAAAVINAILDGNNLRKGKLGDEGVIKSSDFNHDRLSYILSNIKHTTVKDFNDAYNGSDSNIWSKIFKGDFSGKFRKIGGGLDFEAELADALQDLILGVEPAIENKITFKRANELFDKISDSSTIKRLKTMKLNKDTISKYVFVSGKGSTARNKYGQIINTSTLDVNIDKKLNIDSADENAIQNVLTQSGKIIADVTITTDDNFDKSDINHVNRDDIYISCKDGASQFSGISFQSPFYGTSKKTNPKSDLIDSFKNDDTYSEFIDKKSDNVKAFQNLCKLLCVDPEMVYDYFKKPRQNRTSQKFISTGDAVNGDVISTLIQLLIGGNYWYVNTDSEPIFIPDDIETNAFKFIPDNSGHLDPSQIVITGKMNGVKAELKFRDSNGTKDGYPFRLFIVPSAKHLIHDTFGKL